MQDGGDAKMSLIRWDPFQEVSDLHRTFSRLLDDPLRRDPVSQFAFGRGFPVDIYETADEVVVCAELPGATPENVSVQMQGSQLTIKATRRLQVPEGSTWLRQETAEGEYLRSFNLGLPVKPEAIRATYRDGILNVHLPKSDEVRPRQIRIES